MPSSKSSTSSISRSTRPMSLLRNIPVQTAQCTFFNVLSFKYCEKECVVSYCIGAHENDTNLGSDDECPEEDTFESPLLKSDLEVWPRSVDVYEGCEESGHGDLCASEDVLDECGELGVFRTPGHSSGLWVMPCGPGHCIVDCFDDGVYDIICVVERREL